MHFKYLFPLFLFLSISTFSQTTEDEPKKSDEDLILDSLLDDDADKDVDDLLAELFKDQKDLEDLKNSIGKFQFLYVSMNYNSKTYFAGRDLDENGYNAMPQISYINSKGFFASVSQAYFSEIEPKWNFTGLTAGYGKSFGKNKKFRYAFGYSRFLYHKDEPNPFTNSITANIGLRNKKRTFGTRLSTNYSFGNDANVFQTTASVFGVFNIINTKKYRLQTRPRIDILAGQQQAGYDTGGTITITEENGEDVEYVAYEYRNTFDLMNIQISLPLLVSTEKWDFELGYNYNIPNTPGDEPDYKNTNFFHISIGYLLEL